MNGQAVSIPKRDLGEFRRRSPHESRLDVLFQSLKGIWVNFDQKMRNKCAKPLGVSIPKRDLGEFRPEPDPESEEAVEFQSLKGIWVNFDPRAIAFCTFFARFQSLKGIWVNFDCLNQKRREVDRPLFQSLKGIWVNFDSACAWDAML